MRVNPPHTHLDVHAQLYDMFEKKKLQIYENCYSHTCYDCFDISMIRKW